MFVHGFYCPNHTNNYLTVHCIQVKCKHRLSGCTWYGELRDLDSHLRNDCHCVLLSCTNHCGCVLQRIELQTHLTDECCLRIVVCQFCAVQGTFEFVVNDHSDECPMMPVECPNKCGSQSLLRKDLSEHSKVCPLEMVECPFDIIGCKVVTSRVDLLQHMDSDRDVHLLKAAKTFHQVHYEMDLRTSNLQQILDSVKNLETEVERLKSTVRNLQTHQAEHARRSSAGSDRALLTPTSSIHRRSSDLHSPATPNEVTVTSIRQLLSQIGSSNQTSHLSSPGIMELHLSVQASQSLSEPFLPVLIKMEDFEHKKLNRVTWQSPSFYTDPFGYKLCLVVYANGCCGGENTHLSVFVHVMAGEFDDQNDWPIDEEISVELQNQLEPRRHHSVDCSLTRSKPLHIRRKVQRSPESNARARKGSGTPLFITHSALYSSVGRCQYLKNNCLYFAVY